MNKELQELANKLLSKGKRVFINEKNELFTEENLAKNGGSPYKEYFNPKLGNTPAPEAKKSYAQENNETLIEMINERGLELGEAKVKKDFVAILEADDLKKAEEKTGEED